MLSTVMMKIKYVGYILEVYIKYPEQLGFSLMNYLFLAKKMKINKKIICNLNDKEKYVIYATNLKEALNHGLVIEKVHKVINLIKRIG